jgi:hypothetical protein
LDRALITIAAERTDVLWVPLITATFRARLLFQVDEVIK